MNIILEGVDCSGKDTLAEYLHKLTGNEIVRGSSFEISKLGSNGMFSFTMNQLNEKNLIINRSFYSNLVYGELFNYPMMEDWQYKTLRKKIFDTDTLVIYLEPPINIIEERLQLRGDDMIKVQNVESIINKYRDVWKSRFSPHLLLRIDTSLPYKGIIDSMFDKSEK